MPHNELFVGPNFQCQFCVCFRDTSQIASTWSGLGILYCVQRGWSLLCCVLVHSFCIVCRQTSVFPFVASPRCFEFGSLYLDFCFCHLWGGRYLVFIPHKFKINFVAFVRKSHHTSRHIHMFL